MILEEILNSNEYQIQDVQNVDSVAIYKAQNNAECAYFIASNNKLAKIVVPKNEYLNCSVKSVTQDNLVIQKEDPYKDAFLEKEIVIPFWINENARLFEVNLNDVSKNHYNWTPGLAENWDDMPSHEVFAYHAPHLIEKYNVVELDVTVFKNFMPIASFKDENGEYYNSPSVNNKLQSLISSLEKQNVVYMPKCDVVNVHTNNEDYKKLFETNLEQLIPHF